MPGTGSEARLVREAAKRITSIGLPDAVDEKLTLLREVVEAVGERTSRQELLAAFVVQAPTEGSELASILREYRTTRVGDLKMRRAAENVVPLRHRGRRPGRPRGT